MSAGATRKTRLAPKKIDSPLAKYNSAGQLSCILCALPIKSDLLWVAHVSGKSHRENAERAKKERVLPISGVKRPAESLPKGVLKKPAVQEPPKVIKSILKNPLAAEQVKQQLSSVKSGESSASQVRDVPKDFFDTKTKPTTLKTPLPVNTDEETFMKSDGNAVVPKSTRAVSSNEEAKPKDSEPEVPIPEGFFDDPVQDAKARHVEYKDPLDEEYAKFTKTIQEANVESSALVQADEEEDATERQLDEIDEQMRNWSRVVALEKKKDELQSEANKVEFKEEAESSDDEDDFDEGDFIDWRSKSIRHSS